MKKEKTTMIKEDELKQIYGGCIEEPSLKTGPYEFLLGGCILIFDDIFPSIYRCRFSLLCFIHYA